MSGSGEAKHYQFFKPRMGKTMAEASILFRNKDMRSTPKIYVDYMGAAARIAATYHS